MSSPLASTTPCRFGEIYLHAGSESFDLHNCFDFVAFTYEPSSQVARLRWMPNGYGSVPQSRSLVVEFRGVTHFSAAPRDPELPFSEDTCLAEVGGVTPSDPTVAGIYSDVPSGWHHIFTFMSGFVLRIGAESVSLLPNDI
jgi:hypothetical protein